MDKRLAAMIARFLLCADLNLDSLEPETEKLCDSAYGLLAEACGVDYPAGVQELQSIIDAADQA